MKTKKMLKVIESAIETANAAGEAPVRESILVALITKGAKATTAMAAITKAFKAAGIITVTSNTALKECREYLAESMPDMPTYSDMTQHAADMQSKFDINDDEEKGTASALKLIRAQLKKDELDVPKKIQLGLAKESILNYFMDAKESDDDTSVEGLAERLVADVFADIDEDTITDEMKAKQKITAGTYYNFAHMAVNGLRLEDVN